MNPITVSTFYLTLLISYPISWSPCLNHLYTNGWDGGSTRLGTVNNKLKGVFSISGYILDIYRIICSGQLKQIY